MDDYSAVSRAAAQAEPWSKALFWCGRILGWLCLLFLTFDAVLHLWKPSFIASSFTQLGVPEVLSRPMGVIELAAVVLTLIPRTTLLGVVLFTAYLGGATAIQARVGGDAWFSVVCGAILWFAAYVQYPKVREVFPIHK